MSRKRECFLFPVILFLLISSCKETGNEPPSQSGGLSANPPSVRLRPGTNQDVIITAGTKPYSVGRAPDASIATAALVDAATLRIHGASVGNTSVRVGDNSSPAKSVDISITVATSAAAVLFGDF